MSNTIVLHILATVNITRDMLALTWTDKAVVCSLVRHYLQISLRKISLNNGLRNLGGLKHSILNNILLYLIITHIICLSRRNVTE